MLLHAIVLNSDIEEGMFYDQKTGAEKPNYWINMTVIDAETNEKYNIQVIDGYASLNELKDLKRQNATTDQLRKAAERLKQTLPQKLTQLDLEVLRIKGKQTPYLKLVCRLIQIIQKGTT